MSKIVDADGAEIVDEEEASEAAEYGVFSSPLMFTQDSEEVDKERVYIDDPSEAPEDANVQEGARGGLYYEVADIEEIARALPEGLDLHTLDERPDEPRKWRSLDSAVMEIDGQPQLVGVVTVYKDPDGSTNILLEDKEGEMILGEDGDARVFNPDDIGHIYGETKTAVDEWGRAVTAEIEPPAVERNIPEDPDIEWGPHIEDGWWESGGAMNTAQETAIDYLSEYYDEETVEKFKEDILFDWSMMGYSSAHELWYAAMGVLGTDEPPSALLDRDNTVDESKLAKMDDELVQLCADFIYLNQDVAQDHFDGDEVEAHRQFSQEVIEKYAHIDEEGNVTIKPQVLESWSVNEKRATNHAGTPGPKVTMDVSVEEIALMGPLALGPTNRTYKEITLMRTDPYEIDSENIRLEHTVDELDKQDYSDLYRIPAVNSVEREPPSEEVASGLAKEWVPYTGPMGGEGWQHVETGEIVYSDEPPGTAIVPDEGADTYVPNKELEDYDINGEFEHQVAEAVIDGKVTDIKSSDWMSNSSEVDDPGLLIDTLKQLVTGDGTKTARVRVENRLRAEGFDDQIINEEKRRVRNPVNEPVERRSLKDKDFYRYSGNSTQFHECREIIVEGQHVMEFFFRLPDDPRELLELHEIAVEQGEYERARNISAKFQNNHQRPLEVETLPSRLRFDPDNYEGANKKMAEYLEREGEFGSRNYRPLDFRENLEGRLSEMDTEVLYKAFQFGMQCDKRVAGVNTIRDELKDRGVTPEDLGVNPEKKELFNEAGAPTTDESDGYNENWEKIWKTSTTSEIEALRDYAKWNTYNHRQIKALDVMLAYRDDSSVKMEDVVELDFSNIDLSERQTRLARKNIREGMNESFIALEPEVATQVFAADAEFDVRLLSGNKAGSAYSQDGSIEIDPKSNNVVKIVSHEVGHQVHNTFGVESENYNDIDNRDVDDRDQWRHGIGLKADDNPHAQQFHEEAIENWEEMRDEEVWAMRSYQHRHGVENLAVTFAYYSHDTNKLKYRDPLSYVFWEKYAQNRDTLDDPSEIEKGDEFVYYNERKGKYEFGTMKDVDRDEGIVWFDQLYEGYDGNMDIDVFLDTFEVGLKNE